MEKNTPKPASSVPTKVIVPNIVEVLKRDVVELKPLLRPSHAELDAAARAGRTKSLDSLRRKFGL